MLSITEVLSEKGPFVSRIKNYRVRQAQLDLAESIATALVEGKSLIAEAGTGTGKTFAYLVPAILSGNKILISTGTKHLQDQIYHKDLPVVLDALKKPVNTSLLKGRANYYCLFHAEQSLSETNNPKIRQEIVQVRDWAHSREIADLNDILPDRSPLFHQLASTTENCLGADCEYYEQCHVLKARKKAMAADIIVVNHHLLLADMSLRDVGFGELLPEIDTIIFDEAHQLPELASQFFGSSISARQFMDVINDSRKAYQQEANDLPEFPDQLHALETGLGKFRACFKQSEQRTEWHLVYKIPAVKEAINSLYQQVKTLELTLSELAKRGNQLDAVNKRILLISAWLESFLNEEHNDHIQWLELRGKGFLLHQTPLVIASLFKERIKHYDCNAIYTSATLAVSSSFKHYTEQLGLEDVESKQWPSPFDFQNQSLLYLPTNMPDPNSVYYIPEVIERALPVLESSQGRAFMLFTSHNALQMAYQLLQGKLPYPLLRQGNSSRTDLLNRFRKDQHSILLATASFWEGVDVKGSSLSCVIIDKLPFAMPDDPVLRARGTVLQQQGKNLFKEHQLPKAVIQLKQGVGRLIRDPEDTGVLMICDPRLRSKSYGKIFLKSLPDMNQTQNVEEVKHFYQRHQNTRHTQ